MAWESRGKKRYFYQSVRVGGQVRKLYFGAGPAGDLAAAVVALVRAERDAADRDRRRARDQLDAAVAASLTVGRECDLLAAATLLAAGYHRPGRHSWRRWNDGRRILRETDPGEAADAGRTG